MSGKGRRKPTRRNVLQAGAALAAGAGLGGEAAAESCLRAGPFGPLRGESWYDQLNIKPVINAGGTFTALGGSVMPPEVVAAWADAAKSFVDLVDLQNKVGERIAKLVGHLSRPWPCRRRIGCRV